MSLKGSCACGAVTIDVADEKPAAYANCHCSQCRRQGRPFGSWAVFPADKVKLSFKDGKEAKEGKEKARVIAGRHCAAGLQMRCVGQEEGREEGR